MLTPANRGTNHAPASINASVERPEAKAGRTGVRWTEKAAANAGRWRQEQLKLTRADMKTRPAGPRFASRPTSQGAGFEPFGQIDVVGVQLLDRCAPAQRHGRVEFLVDDLQRRRHALLAHRSKAV